MQRIIAINRFTSSRKISVGMAVEYHANLNIYSVEPDAFTVSDRTLLACYVNSVPALRERRDSVPGRYVILELEPKELQTGTIGRCMVRQCKNLRFANSQLIPPWEEPQFPIALQYKQVDGCQHCLVRLKLDAPVLSVIIAEPRNYRISQRYPLYVEFARNGNYQQGEMFGLIFRNAEGWAHLADDDPLLVTARKVFQYVMFVYSIDVEQVYLLGMDAHRADRLLDARFPTKPALENPLRAKWD